jgi:hypothetical protein
MFCSFVGQSAAETARADMLDARQHGKLLAEQQKLADYVAALRADCLALYAKHDKSVC